MRLIHDEKKMISVLQQLITGSKTQTNKENNVKWKYTAGRTTVVNIYGKLAVSDSVKVQCIITLTQRQAYTAREGPKVIDGIMLDQSC